MLFCILKLRGRWELKDLLLIGECLATRVFLWLHSFVMFVWKPCFFFCMWMFLYEHIYSSCCCISMFLQCLHNKTVQPLNVLKSIQNTQSQHISVALCSFYLLKWGRRIRRHRADYTAGVWCKEKQNTFDNRVSMKWKIWFLKACYCFFAKFTL